jgi:hypothetical protein
MGDFGYMRPQGEFGGMGHGINGRRWVNFKHRLPFYSLRDCKSQEVTAICQVTPRPV